MSRSVLIVFILSCLTGGAAAADAEKAARFLQDLGSDKFETREAAERGLIELGREALPAVRAAATGSADAEVRWRAGRVVSILTRLPWHRDLEEARAEARERCRPILVVSTFGGPEAPGCAAALALRTVTLGDRETLDRLEAHFTFLWHDRRAGSPSLINHDAPELTPGGDEADLRSFVCDPDGRVLFVLGGWWPADVYREEMEFAAGLKADESLRLCLDGRRLQREASSLIRLEQGPDGEFRQRPEAPEAAALRTALDRWVGPSCSLAHASIDGVLAQLEQEAQGRR